LEVNSIYTGDVLKVMETFPNESIDCVITSPPYWQLRDYGYPDQWGLEPTYQEYLEHLWQFMDEVKRVLKETGTVWINLGDTYNGNKTGNDDPVHNTYPKNPVATLVNKKKIIEIPDKCLLLIPHRFAIGCIDRGWIMRNDIIWAKRNGMPESTQDRFSKKHEYFFLIVKNKKYYFDLESIKDSGKPDKSLRDRDNTRLNNTPGRAKMGGLKINDYINKNPGSVSDFWDIPTLPSSEEHYAAYNSRLIEKPIVAG